ncbi:MAG: 2-oxo acid dehydrogenase subunit E2 [Bacteroidales bacterium]|nr:2-oxo acid dehydrogenase subunit E2 [Bacteroidales bacterium]
MAKFEILLPKLGESIIEATITKWLKAEGDRIEEDEPIAELATDKVDSEIPSPVEGVITKILFEEGEVVEVGKVIAYITLDGDDTEDDNNVEEENEIVINAVEVPESASDIESHTNKEFDGLEGFYSPLVKSIAKKENISPADLQSIKGTGQDGRVTKRDILNFIETKDTKAPIAQSTAVNAPKASVETKKIEAPAVSVNQGDQIVEMDRMRKLIADHMVMSKQVSPHVTSFIEVDMTRIVKWRNKTKDAFQKREGEKITFMPIFVEAAAKALKDFPGVNASVDGHNVILRKNVNIGMAAALPSGNLIVPVIKDADQKNLLGLTKNVNDLANRARANKLAPDDISGGTFTITNLGSFDSITGTPIINQPQVAILGLGVIQKKPAVIETPEGDVIAIRHQCILSLAYDHRVVDGALGGMYLQRVKKYLEEFDINRAV